LILPSCSLTSPPSDRSGDMTLAHDELTGLHDRSSFLSLLRQHVTDTGDGRGQLALVVVDIDGFAQVNIASGYAAGDRALAHVAHQLRHVARPQDDLARIGDNRFALLLSRIRNRGHAELAMQKLYRLLKPPLEGGPTQIALQVSAGVALCPAHATSADQLLRQAEMALEKARMEGRRYQFAPDVPQTSGIFDLWELELELAGAIDRGEISMHYQPQVHLADFQLAGVEALMRWESPGRGMISPEVFIPIAERIGQMKKLTVWALNTVLRQTGQWRHAWGRLTVAVNMPGELANQPDLADLVENALNLWGKDDLLLALEITERSLMDREHAEQMLERIRALGVRISIDDFGTGYSCLAYFKNIPADELKIDKSFVAGLLTDTASADIIALIIQLAHRFGLAVVAEGVEERAVFQRLRESGCDLAQGYLIGRPMTASQFQAWLDDYDAGADES
jgi:diguanylate cyclase (GGDEF)-like protein